MMGDLLEMCRPGRSRTWYWRQGMAALLLARARARRPLPGRGFGTALLRLVNAVLLAGIIALGMRSLTQADPARIDSHRTYSR
jgi:hypothetical protein